jgi:peptidoglycan/xylan/chitin deacetylase (PgdA/CDA1 family)
MIRQPIRPSGAFALLPLLPLLPLLRLLPVIALAACRHGAPERVAPPTSAGGVPAVTPVVAGCAELRTGGVAVSLTYDDSLQSQIDNAGPDLARYGLLATFFVQDVRPDPAPWQALRAHGHEIGSHTMNHPCPRINTWVKPGFASEDYDLPRMTAELDDSVGLLRSLGQTGPLSFAYPCGVTTVGEAQDSYIPAVKERFAAARRVSSTVAPLSVDPYLTPGIFMTTAGSTLVGRVAAAGTGGWVIFGFHGVGGDHLSVPRDAHAELLAYLDAHRSTVWTAPFGTVATCLRDH